MKGDGGNANFAGQHNDRLPLVVLVIFKVSARVPMEQPEFCRELHR
jgi:hypothetical protein